MNERTPLPGALALVLERDMIPEGSTVLCAVSGGADSICLLHWLASLRARLSFTLIAAHYNHTLRGEESQRDEAFVRSFLRQCCPAVELIVGRGDVAAEAQVRRQGIEETAREMRYDFLWQVARQVGAQVIATAHNADDNAETVLLNLSRGCGLRGLTGIPPCRDGIVRPLLTTHRSEIEDYLRAFGLPHVEDSSNNDTNYTRNRLRHQVMPTLRDIQPRITQHLCRTAQLLEQDEVFLTGQARKALPVPTAIPGGLSVPAQAIAARPDPLAVRMVRLLLDELTHRPCSGVHLTALVALCRTDDPSARLSLPHGITARRVYDRLEMTVQPLTPPAQSLPLPLPGQISVPGGVLTICQTPYDGQDQLPDHFFLSCAKTEEGLTLRARASGDSLTRPGRQHRTLKKLMIDEKLPRHLRDTVPVLDCGGRVAAVVGLGPDSAFLPVPGEDCWQFVFTRKKPKGTDEHET